MPQMKVDNIVSICPLNRYGEGISWMESKGDQSSSWRRGCIGAWKDSTSCIDAELDES